MKKSVINLHLPEELKKQVDEEAKKELLPVAAFVRQLIKKHLDERNRPSEKELNRQERERQKEEYRASKPERLQAAKEERDRQKKLDAAKQAGFNQTYRLLKMQCRDLSGDTFLGDPVLNILVKHDNPRDDITPYITGIIPLDAEFLEKIRIAIEQELVAQNLPPYYFTIPQERRGKAAKSWTDSLDPNDPDEKF